MNSNGINVGSTVILKSDNMVLLGKRKNMVGAGEWGFPGGHVEKGEQLIEAAKREVFEETNLILDDVRFVGIINQPKQGAQANPPQHYLQTVFVSEKFHGELINNEPEFCEGWEWFDINNLPQNIFFAHVDFLPLLNSSVKYFER